MTVPTTSDEDLPALADITTGAITVTGTTMTLVGDIDYDLVRSWQAENPGPHDVHVVHADQVTFLNSAGIAFLLRLAKASSTRLQLRQPSRPARRPLEVMGAGSILDFVD